MGHDRQAHRTRCEGFDFGVHDVRLSGVDQSRMPAWRGQGNGSGAGERVKNGVDLGSPHALFLLSYES